MAKPDWRDAILGDVITVKHGYAFKGKYFGKGGPVRLVTPGNFFEWGGFRDRGADQKSYDGPAAPDYELEPGALVVAMTEQAPGLLGSAGLVPDDEFTWLHNQRIGLVLVQHGLADKSFIRHLLNSPAAREQLAATATGTKVRHTAPSRIEAVRASLPPFWLQRHIGAFLSAFDELIEVNERRIEVLRVLASAIYQRWFAQRDSGTDGSSSDGQREVDPDSWTECVLGDVAEVNRSVLSADELPDPLEYIDISSVRVGRIGPPKVINASDAPGRARRRVADGDVLWSTVRPNRRAHGLVHDPSEEMVASTGLAVLTPTQIPPSYLFEYCASPAFTSYLTGRATGSAYPAVRPRDFIEAPIIVPPRRLLDSYNEVADPLLREASALEGRSLRYAATRDLLLPRLVTGKLDISDIDLGILTPTESE